MDKLSCNCFEGGHQNGKRCGYKTCLGINCSCGCDVNTWYPSTNTIGGIPDGCAGNSCKHTTKNNTCNSCNWCFGQCAVNPEMSRQQERNAKDKITQEAIAHLKETTIWSDINDIELFREPTSEQYKEYFERLSGSMLSLSQQKLILEQITTSFIQENALNLFSNVRFMIGTVNRSQDVTSEQVQNSIHKIMNLAVTNIMLSYQYTPSFLNFNYSQAYQSLYYAMSIYLYNKKMTIIRKCFSECFTK